MVPKTPKGEEIQNMERNFNVNPFNSSHIIILWLSFCIFVSTLQAEPHSAGRMICYKQGLILTSILYHH